MLNYREIAEENF